MNEFFTRAQIDKKSPDEWVLVVDPKTDRELDIKGGTVVLHSKDRDEVYRKAAELQPKRFTVLYTGRMKKGSAIIL